MATVVRGARTDEEIQRDVLAEVHDRVEVEVEVVALRLAGVKHRAL